MYAVCILDLLSDNSNRISPVLQGKSNALLASKLVKGVYKSGGCVLSCYEVTRGYLFSGGLFFSNFLSPKFCKRTRVVLCFFGAILSIKIRGRSQKALKEPLFGEYEYSRRYIARKEKQQQ